ncbi:MAG: class I SAM-dependent methyltransferase [Solirubrobacterales bacterium]|nr:class I SAM-dependent methyltransferase [Solirubrobacterales bacterium]
MSEQTRVRADDPFGGRQPTIHEQRAGQPWDASYLDGPAPWDVGQPQPAVARLASEGAFSGTVLDAGCGTGDNALHIAALSVPVLGVDVAETALSIAGKRAAERGLDAEFVLADALGLDGLGQTFLTVLDCALFHVFRGRGAARVRGELGGRNRAWRALHLLCFGDAGTHIGPHPVAQRDLRGAFKPSSGWSTASIDPDRLLSRFAPQGMPAWRARIERV